MKRSERLAHVRAWRESGLTRPAYCREQGLKYGTFMSWFKLEAEQGNSTEGKFVALSSAPENSGVVEILFPNGIHVQYSGKLTAEVIKQLRDA
ncbi:MAG: hypothetical protein H6573_31485 [Lewinellaceae bacterium]|jgi:hypothetical protein|nr:hypothetical protein [Lewinellaceae bacterium]